MAERKTNIIIIIKKKRSRGFLIILLHLYIFIYIYIRHLIINKLKMSGYSAKNSSRIVQRPPPNTAANRAGTVGKRASTIC